MNLTKTNKMAHFLAIPRCIWIVREIITILLAQLLICSMAITSHPWSWPYYFLWEMSEITQGSNPYLWLAIPGKHLDKTELWDSQSEIIRNSITTPKECELHKLDEWPRFMWGLFFCIQKLWHEPTALLLITKISFAFKLSFHAFVQSSAFKLIFYDSANKMYSSPYFIFFFLYFHYLWDNVHIM